MKASIPILVRRPPGGAVDRFLTPSNRPWILLLTLWTGLAAVGQTHALESDSDWFEKKIRPVLADHCFECHSASSTKLKGGLRLDSRAGLIQGGETGTALVPGKPMESLLYRAMAHLEKDMAMPPRKPKLAPDVLANFETWIRNGAVWPGSESNAVPVAKSEFDMEQRKQRLPWIWQPIAPVAAPEVHNAAWSKSTVDRLILARLNQEGLKPSEPVAPNLWLRRVHFALTGLPPTPADLDAFQQDSSPQARTQVVDRLLASPQFGERWGRHWLDLMRYAESRGHESDFIIPNAYEYRDYVVRAFNLDVPYNQLITEHLAGDLLDQPRLHPEKRFNESVLGTGWAFLGEEIHAPVDTRQDEMDRIDNRIDVMTKSFLGVTVSCARCHDHKFDAISQKDYYALAGFFVSTGQRLARFESMEQERAASEGLVRLRADHALAIREGIAASQRPVLEKVGAYLNAAVAVWQAESTTNRFEVGVIRKPGTNTLAAALQEKVSTLARERQLDPAILAQWTVALAQSAKQEHDLLYPVAKAAFPSLTVPGVNVSATTTALPEPELPKDAVILHKFDSASSRFQSVDGYAFGLAPARMGEFRVVPSQSNRPPGLRLVTRDGATLDPEWSRMGFAPGVEREPGLFGGWLKEGATLRSPKFELKTGRLHYLVRGSGRVLAAVDSQRLVTGPLHTSLLRDWPQRDAWHWVTHDLSPYAGHRVSLEFSPSGEFDSSVACIVESDQVPAQPASAGWLASAAVLQSKVDSTNATQVASVIQELLQRSLRVLTQSQGEATATVADHEVVAWTLRNPGLFSGLEGVWPQNTQVALHSFEQARDQLIAGVTWKSRTAPAMLEGNGVDEYLLVRGKHFSPKGSVPRRFLEAVSSEKPLGCDKRSGRLELAKTMTDPSNPLVARVMVNRVWYHLFGRGIVPSVDNFGWLGQRASHPELIDHLAYQFIHEDDWSIKRLIRRLILTETYAQSSVPSDPVAEEKDPENALLHRMNLKRLEAESIRDAILAVSGRLDLRQGGPSVPLHESQFTEARGLRSERGPLDGEGRRSLYVAARRNFLPMMMTAFDLPTPFTTTGRRNISNVPGQMLFLMNDPFVHQQAQVWAQRLQRDLMSASTDYRIRHLYLSAFARVPSQVELERCRSMIQTAEKLDAKEGVDAWTELCHALIGVKEFIFVR